MPSQTTTILLKCSMVDVPALNHVKLKSLYGSPGTLHKDVGGAGTKVSGKTVGGVGTATLTTLSSINNTSNTSRNKNNPVSQEVSRKIAQELTAWTLDRWVLCGGSP
ncbi:hypothetical protein WH47_07746 [Habropoda laboriosa]|uniref:Uncharacterized protein n=1 Tax=Habropoda laboriosa TaxID=597456 RepID=A0A0L7QPL9_9HYME|nr:hypothetical protein WH47_07746 [Habropoda laboriosa]